MSDPENFLSRWERRKRDVAKENARAESPAAEPAEQPPAPGDDANSVARPPAADVPQAPTFDLSKLPSLDSISANSDITVFLQSGVPSELKHAALRRAWMADPAIRDFVGLAENAWDFTDPDAMPGFGALDSNIDIKRLVAEIFRDGAPDTELLADVAVPARQAEQPAQLSEKPAADAAVDVPVPALSALDGQHEVAAVSDEKALLRREENIAMQRDVSADETAVGPVRRHGGAMPR